MENRIKSQFPWLMQSTFKALWVYTCSVRRRKSHYCFSSVFPKIEFALLRVVYKWQCLLARTFLNNFRLFSWYFFPRSNILAHNSTIFRYGSWNTHHFPAFLLREPPKSYKDYEDVEKCSETTFSIFLIKAFNESVSKSSITSFSPL